MGRWQRAHGRRCLIQCSRTARHTPLVSSGSLTKLLGLRVWRGSLDGMAASPIPDARNLAPPADGERITALALDAQIGVRVSVVYDHGVELRAGTAVAYTPRVVRVQLYARPGQPSYGEAGWFLASDVQREP